GFGARPLSSGDRVDVAAEAVVAGGALRSGLLGTHTVEALGCAEAAIRAAAFDGVVGRSFVVRTTLRLEVGAVLAIGARTFVDIDAKPLEAVEDRVQRAFDEAVAVGVLDAKDERPAVRARVRPAKESGADVAHVRVA